MAYKEIVHDLFQSYSFFDRDLSWLSFNERVLMEAGREDVPLLERFNFLSIYSSNLDEFYRVRMPALAALHKLYKKDQVEEREAEQHADVVKAAREIIQQQLERYGATLHSLIPQLEQYGIVLHYGTDLPEEIAPAVTHYFFTEVLAFLHPVRLSENGPAFFPENNLLYMAVYGTGAQDENDLLLVNVPTGDLPRFFKVEAGGKQHIVFLEDIIKAHLNVLPGIDAKGACNFKITRDAELNLDDEYTEDMAAKIERQIAKRDKGFATRLLYEPGLPEKAKNLLLTNFHLSESVAIEGGRYHNLKELVSLPLSLPELKYKKWPAVQYPVLGNSWLLDLIKERDVMLHTPYHSYDAVLRFFNEAAINANTEHIFLTMYRVASDSRIVNALLSAAGNGKKVTVLIELKARFDEENNIKWAKRLKKTGVAVLYTTAKLKVHAKIALVKMKKDSPNRYAGLLATGNLNESTARFYTDHILMTTNEAMLEEVEKLFRSFEEKQKTPIDFSHLLVAQHNLQPMLLQLIDQEIYNVRAGGPGRITIKLNNLEERVLIRRLYDASNAGVQIDLIVRGICCLVPGVEGQSKNIRVHRIVDRYLEHGRVYIFYNNGHNNVWLGSADWMTRNIYRRVEVCFPVYDEGLKKEVLRLLDIQLRDNVQAVEITDTLQNKPVEINGQPIHSQREIYTLLAHS
ncbi:MAG TPA: polyphosphate kinase 1 [Flavisolibacter sp.]|nr:polyphosphate kinase 1 [Flavisolibacter sp.]